MGYESGRTGDQTKILLNKVDNHALYKGTASLTNDTQANIAANALVVGVGLGCEITDEIADPSLRDKNAIVNISATGKGILVPVNGQVVTTEGDQTISSVKKITSTFNNGIGQLEIGKIEGSIAPGSYYKKGTLTATENGLLKWIGHGSNMGLTLTDANAGSNQFTISGTYGYTPFLNLQWFGAKDGVTHTYVSYIDFPGDKGTSSSHETLACLSDIPDGSDFVHKTGNETITGVKTLDANGEIRFQTDPQDVYYGYIKESSRMTLNIADDTVNIGGLQKTVVGTTSNNIELDGNILPGGRTNVIAIHDSAIDSDESSTNYVTYVFPTRDKTNGSTHTLATTDDLPNYYEVHVVVDQGESGSSVRSTMLFNISSENLDIFINVANAELEPMGYELTKDNWSTLVPQLATANSALRHYLIRGLLMLSNNASAEDIDGFSNMIYVDVNGIIKLGHDTNNYIRVISSTITPITNKF